MGEPLVGLFLAHHAAEVEPVKVAVRLAPERAQLSVGERADGPVCARVRADVCVARRVTLTDVEHGAVGVLSVYPVGAA